MSALLDSALDAERRAQAEAADAALRRTAADAISARQRVEALAAYTAVQALGDVGYDEARMAYARHLQAKPPVTQTSGDLWLAGMRAGVTLVLRKLQARGEGR